MQISIHKLRDRKGLYLNLSAKTTTQGEVVIYLDDASTKHLTLLIIPKSHILLV
jgi:hypothetical protein